MKISGVFRWGRGAEDFATLRSILSTARRKVCNRTETVVQGPIVLLDSLRR